MTDELKNAVLDQLRSPRRPGRNNMSRSASGNTSPHQGAVQHQAPAPAPTITDSLFGQELYVRGWSIPDAAKRWGYSPSYLYRLLKTTEKSHIWEDAARGIPFNELPLPPLQDRGRLDVVADYIRSVQAGSSRQALRVHVFDTTGELALPGADLYDPFAQSDHGLSPLSSSDESVRQQIEHFVALLARWAGATRKQEILAYIETIGTCHQLYLDRGHSKTSDGTLVPFSLASLLAMLKQSILDDELLAHRQRATLLGQHVSAHQDIYTSAPQLLPTSSKAYMEQLRQIEAKIIKAVRAYSELVAEDRSHASALRSSTLETRINLAKLLSRLLETGLFRSRSIEMSASAKIWRYDLGKLSEHNQNIFVVFRLGEIFSKAGNDKEYPLIMLNDTPIPIGTSHKVAQKHVEQFFN